MDNPGALSVDDLTLKLELHKIVGRPWTIMYEIYHTFYILKSFIV
jgi:hypothetical protein